MDKIKDQDWMLEPWKFTGSWPKDGRGDVDLVDSVSGPVLMQTDCEGLDINRCDMLRAVTCVNACAGLSLPSNVPVGALCEVVEALRTSLEEHQEVLSILEVRMKEGEDLSIWKVQTESIIRQIERVLIQLSEPVPAVVVDEGPEIELPLSVIMEKCRDWDAFCNDVGLNPWCVKEGLADGMDTFSAPLSTFQKHGVI